MATNAFLDGATINALLNATGAQSVDADPPDSPAAGAVWWDSSAAPFVRRVFIGGEWQDSGSRFDPATGQVRLLQAGAGLAFEAEAMRLDFASLPVAP